jgi:hypothetical protein
VAVTVSDPAGALLAVQEPDPEERFAVHKVVPPMANVTLPVGVPAEPELASAALAQYVTSWPNDSDAGLTSTRVELRAWTTLSEAVPEDPP